MPDELPVLSVSDLTMLLKGVVEAHFPSVWVSGEISNFMRAGSGHLYFTLKDDEAQLKAVMWRSAAQRLKFQLHDGLEVLASGPIEVYASRGQYQIIVDRMQPQGLGRWSWRCGNCSRSWRRRDCSMRSGNARSRCFRGGLRR